MKRTSLTQTETVGFARNLLELILRIAGILEKAGFHVAEIKEILTKKLDYAATLNARQEALKREMKNVTAEVEAAHADLYKTASGYLDGFIGAVGKGSSEAKNLQLLRSRIRMPGDQTAEMSTPGEPAPDSQR